MHKPSFHEAYARIIRQPIEVVNSLAGMTGGYVVPDYVFHGLRKLAAQWDRRMKKRFRRYQYQKRKQ